MSKQHPHATAELDSRPVTTAHTVWPASSSVALALLAVAHFLVDVVAGSTNPIWPTLERDLSLRTGGLLWVYVGWTVATSFGQLLFAIWADRRRARWLIWSGPLAAILCISCVGLPTSSIGLAVLFVVGGLGVAAFHPEAAATAGSLFPEQRSRAVAVFALCGYLGQSVGPYYSGTLTDQLGTRGLTWGIVWGTPLLFALWIGWRRVSAPFSLGEVSPSGTSPTGAPLGVLLLLVAVGATRVLPALGVPLALAYLLEATSTSNSVIGAVQSAFMAGIGVGAIVCAAFVRHQWERTSLWLFPLLAAPLLTILTFASGTNLVLLVGMCGLLLGVTMPVYISYGQQLLPHGQRTASSITMGVSWGIGGGLVAAAMWVFNAIDALPWVFGFFSISSLASSLMCHVLPVHPRS